MLTFDDIMLKYILLARRGSGRQFFERLLTEKHFRIAEPHKLTKSDKTKPILSFTKDDETYYYTTSDIENADIISINPDNIQKLCSSFPTISFRFIEIMASNEDRIRFAVKDADDKITAEEDFVAACEAENDEYSRFEDKIVNNGLKINNISMGHIVNNDFSQNSDIYGYVDKLITDIRTFRNTQAVIKILIANKLIKQDPDNDNNVIVINSNHKSSPMAIDIFTENILTDHDGMTLMMTRYLGLETTII